MALRPIQTSCGMRHRFALAAAQPAPETVRAAVMEDWGAKVGEEVWTQWVQKQLSPEQLRAEIRQFRDRLPELCLMLCEDLQPSAMVAACIAESGGPTQPEDLTVSMEEYRKAQRAARYLRNRFTILDLAAELGAT